MSNDKTLIFEKYNQNVLFNEEIYASTKKTGGQLTKHDPGLGGGSHQIGYAIGTHATKINKDPHEIAMDIAKIVITKLFKPGEFTHRGVEYDLKYDGTRKELEKEIQKIIMDEFKGQGYKAHFREALHAARDIAGKIINVSTERGGARQIIGQTQSMANLPNEVEDSLKNIFQAEIKLPPILDLNTEYKINADVDIFKALDALNEEQKNDALAAYKAIENYTTLFPVEKITGSQLIDILGKEMSLPYSKAKEALNILIQNSILSKATL